MEKKLLLTITVIILTFGSFYAQAQSWSGSGTSSSPYLITNPAELEALAIEVNGGTSFAGTYFELNADIDLSNYTSGVGWIPIGGYELGGFFAGHFDGKGHKIINLTIDEGNVTEIGLFGYVGSTGRIKNLTVETSAGGIFTLGLAGCIVGYNEGIIENCNAKGNIDGVFATGVLVGTNLGSIINCHSDGNINAGGDAIGGLVGENLHGGVIELCSSTSTIEGTSNNTGGLVGYNNNNSIIRNCFSIGSVGGYFNVGGLVGINENSTIENCYSTCDVRINYILTPSISNINSGGLVGSNIDNSFIKSCYSVGSVNGYINVGGLAGHNDNSSIELCYSTGSVSGNSVISGLVGNNPLPSTISNCYSMPYIVGNDSLYIGSNKIPDLYIKREGVGINGRLASLPFGNWSVSPNNYPYLSNLPVRTLNVIDAPYLSVNVNYGIVANEIINPTRYGYDFIDGWFIGGGSKYDFSQIVYQDIDLYGDWYLIPTLIIEQPESAVLCLSTNGIHTFNVRATGTDVTYQWYKNGQPIQNAINSWYEATNIIDDYSADFYVRASGFGGAVTSQEVNVRAINPLPAVLEFEETPSTNRLTTKQDYVFSVKDYMDVRDWLWTSSSGNVILSASEGSKSITARFIQTGQDTIHVTFVQACTSGVGYKSISFPVTIENATDNENIDNTSLSVYPNPTNGRVTVSGLTEGEEISLYNFSGSKVKSYISTGSVMKIDLSVLPNGIYLLRTSSGVAKVIKN